MEPSLWLKQFEEEVIRCNGKGLEKDVLLEFLDEVSLDFYFKIARFVYYFDTLIS